jgi:tight adherence protein B
VSLNIIYILIAIVVVILAAVIIFFMFSMGSSTSANEQALRSLVLSQRAEKKLDIGKNSQVGVASNNKSKGEAAVLASRTSTLKKGTKDVERATLAQRLIFAQWTITDTQFNILCYSITAIVGAGVFYFLETPLSLTVILLTPILVKAVLARAVKRRFENFDRDFPDFLMTLVSRLRSGMNIMTAMQSCCENLNDDSLLKAEIILMLDRVRVGYQEDQAIGAFAETVPHPEIELFVQAVILNRKVGGNFASTLERLAKQVRKRQDFRRKAVSAVSEQRGGSLMLCGIMGTILVFFIITSPDLISKSFETPTGRMAFQFGGSMCLWGLYLVRRITNLRV